MEVEVWYGLEGGGPVVLNQIQTIRGQALSDATGNSSGEPGGRQQVHLWNLEKRLDVNPGNHQHMAIIDRMNVHDGYGLLVLRHPQSRQSPVQNRAEDTLGHSTLVPTGVRVPFETQDESIGDAWRLRFPVPSPHRERGRNRHAIRIEAFY